VEKHYVLANVINCVSEVTRLLAHWSTTSIMHCFVST